MSEEKKVEETIVEANEKEVEEVQTPYKSKISKALDKFWGVTKSGSSFKVEIFAGIATFLAMVYILTVNPDQILYASTADIRWSSLFIATAFGAIIGTLLMAFLAKMPLAQASGMGLNATVGSVIGGGLGFFGYTYSYSLANALLLVLISGVIFLLLSIVPIKKDKKTGKFVTLREKIFDGMPVAVRTAITVGIGLFIAFIGMQNAHIVASNQYTLLQFVDFKSAISGNADAQVIAAQAIVGLFSLVVIAILSHYKIKGSVIFGILAATILAIPLQVADVDILLGNGEVSWKFWENFSKFFASQEDGGVFAICFTEGFNFPKESLATSIMLVVTFCMIDMFDTMGTVVGCATNAGLVDEDGKPYNYNKIMYSDSIATFCGAIVGTSTVTTFVESGTGVAAGGKTGMTAFVVAVLFFISIFLAPLFAFIPTSAAAGALMYVGVLMMSNVKKIDFTEIKNAVPAFLTIVMMPLTYSITNGIGIGIISYVVISVLVYLVDLVKYLIVKNKKEDAKKPAWEISIVALVVTALFFVYFLVPTVF